jgi:hypothetical protein
MPGGASNWASQAEYETVTTAILEMGGYMQTHPTEGTTCCGREGLIEYLETHAPGKFTVSDNFASKMSAPSLADLAFGAVIGGFVHPMIGWYANTGPNEWDKVGGHVTTLVGITGFCGGGPRSVSIRDPGNGNASLIAQSFFSTETYTAQPLNGFFNSEDNGGITVHYQRTHERLLGYNSGSSLGLLNGMRVVLPKFGVTIDPLRRDELMLHYPIQPTHPTGPVVQNLPLATAGEVIDFALDPTQLRIYYTGETSTGAPDPRVFRLERATGVSTPVYTGVAPTALECGRSKQLFILDGSTLVAIDNQVVPPALAFPSVPPGVAAIAYNDLTDELLCLRPGASQLSIVNGRDPAQPPRTVQLPSGLALVGDPFMCVSPSGAVWVRSKNSPNIYKLSIPRTGAATIMETLTNASFVGDVGIDAHMRQTREHILLARQTGVVEYWKDPASGQWVPAPTSDFVGRAAHKAFRLSRSRTNFDPATMDGPNNFEILPTSFGPSTPDCAGDLDGDGLVGSADLAAMLGSWGPATESPADLNGDGVVNAADLAALLGSWGPCL